MRVRFSLVPQISYAKCYIVLLDDKENKMEKLCKKLKQNVTPSRGSVSTDHNVEMDEKLGSAINAILDKRLTIEDEEICWVCIGKGVLNRGTKEHYFVKLTDNLGDPLTNKVFDKLEEVVEYLKKTI